jgi:hypothetical protein
MPNVKITLNDGSTKTVKFDEGFTDADIEEVANQLNASLKPEKKGIDLTPGGIYKSYRALLDVPSTQTKDHQINTYR